MEKHGHNFCYLNFLWIHWLWQHLLNHLVDLKGLSLFRSQAWWIKAVFPQKKMKDVICSLFTVKREWEKSLSFKNLMTSLGISRRKKSCSCFSSFRLELLLFYGPFSLRRPSCFFFVHQEVIFRIPSRVGLSILSAVEWILFNFPIPWYWRWGVSVLVVILTALIHLLYSCCVSFVPIVHSWAFSVH